MTAPSENLRQCQILFEFVLNEKNARRRKQLVKQLSQFDKFRKALREISCNIQHYNIRLTEKDKRSLRPFSRVLNSLSCADNCIKRRSVTQKGKGLGLLLSLLPIALQAINGLRQ